MMSNLLFTLSLSMQLWSGAWIGSGEAISNPGTSHERKRNCSEIALQVEVSEQILKWQDGYYKCQDLQATYDPTLFTLKNGMILLKGEPVGEYSKNKIHIQISDTSDNSIFDLQLFLLNNNTQISYQEKWIQATQQKLVINGLLNQKM